MCAPQDDLSTCPETLVASDICRYYDNVPTESLSLIDYARAGHDIRVTSVLRRGEIDSCEKISGPGLNSTKSIHLIVQLYQVVLNCICRFSSIPSHRWIW